MHQSLYHQSIINHNHFWTLNAFIAKKDYFNPPPPALKVKSNVEILLEMFSAVNLVEATSSNFGPLKYAQIDKPLGVKQG